MFTIINIFFIIKMAIASMPFVLYNLVMNERSNCCCNCHCGTRITIDQQLLQERQSWKEKYLCLQAQLTSDIGRLKENIYSECATLMQKEFNARQTQQSDILNDKHNEITNLTARIINLEAKGKVIEKENQILKRQSKELEADILQKDAALQNIRSRGNKSERDWEVKLEEEVTMIRKRISLQYQDEIKKIETENQHLKHKIRQYQKKYQIMIPEVEKLKALLNSKNQQQSQMEGRLEKAKKDSEQQVSRIKNQCDEIQRVHAKCKGTIAKLSDRIESLTQQVEANKKVKKEVKIQPVYIERPVQVQKIVQKIVEVERIVNKYIQPTTYRDQELEKEVARLREDNAHLVKELQLFDDKFKFTVHEFQLSIFQHQQNQAKYKKERQTLVRTIEEQHRQLDTIHVFLERKKYQSRKIQPQKIIVHVNKDGNYQKTVERMASPCGSSRQTNTRFSKKR